MVAAASVALLVVAPVTRRGWLLLLDWSPGPHMSIPRTFWGLDGGLLSSLPFGVAALAAGRLVGNASLGWLPIALAVAGAWLSMGRLVGGRLRRRLPAGLLYAVNPLVFERVFAGHVAYLLAYALLPLAVASLLEAVESRRLADVSRPVIWTAVLVGMGSHFAWIVAVVCTALLVHRRSGRTLGRLVAFGVGTGLTSAYLVVPLVGRPAPITVGPGDLAAFRTVGDPQLGLFANVAGLYGFWRRDAPLPKDDVAGWSFFLVAIILVVAAGAYRARRVPEHRHLVAVVATAGLLGYFLALGDQGPTGPVFRWLFVHLPGFAVMREPQKFVALVALAYAVLFGFGADSVISGTGRHWGKVAAGAAIAALPLSYTPTLFFGLAGRISVSAYPDSWTAADRLMGDAPGRALFLPWHQYLSFPFTGRIIANPADGAFRRDVIAGDNVELATVPTASRSTRSAYLEFLYANGPGLCSFGDLVSPLGVEYVLLARTVDWGDYAWLDLQVDLEKVLDSPEIVLYRNLRYRGLGWRAESTVQVADWSEVVRLSEQGQVSGRAVTAARQAPGPAPVRQSRCARPGGGESPGDGAVISPRSPVAFDVGPGRPGTVVLSDPYEPTWQLHGRGAFELAGGVTGLQATAGSGSIRFGHWNRVRLGYGVTAGTLLFLLFLAWAGRGRCKVPPKS